MALYPCPDCGNSVSDRATQCPKCGSPLQPRISPKNAFQDVAHQVTKPAQERPTLTPEQDAYLNKFHWGAFGFSWIWALFNNLVLHGAIALAICLLTSGGVIFIVSIVFGIKGYRWAWEQSTTESFDEFIKQQEQWNKWSIFFCILTALLVIFVIWLCLIMAS